MAMVAEAAEAAGAPIPATAEAIRGELARMQEAFPFPAAELERTPKRRWITQYARKGGIGAEIGVFRGHFSEMLLGALKPRKLYLVDQWELQGPSFGWSDEYTCGDTLTTGFARREVELRRALHPAAEVVIRQARFPACAAEFAEPLDWLYLDASHAYEATLVELEAAATLIKPDGVIMGDDWHPNPWARHHGVFRAVNEFIKTAPFEFAAAGRAAQWCIRPLTRY